MKCVVFYSWQSDLPNTTNRGFIQSALERAAKAIRADDSVKVEPVIDRDTQGLTGSPDIIQAICNKIDDADIFVADVSIINPVRRADERAVPNPNVSIELGYALKALGWERVILIINEAFGEQKLLPFDLLTKRAIRYNVPEAMPDRTDQRKALQNTLETALRGLIVKLETKPAEPSVIDQTVAAIEGNQPKQKLMTRRFMQWIVGELDRHNPELKTADVPDELLWQTLHEQRTVEIVADFARVAEVIALVDTSDDAARAVYEGFREIVQRYQPPPAPASWMETEFDYFKVMGYELFTTFFAFLIRENRWELMAALLENDFWIDNIDGSGRSQSLPYPWLNQGSRLLHHRNQRLNLRTSSIQGGLIAERHGDEMLNGVVPLQEFATADFFLFVRSHYHYGMQQPAKFEWSPWTWTYLTNIPRFLVDARSKRHASRLLTACGMPDLQSLQLCVASAFMDLQQTFPGIYLRFNLIDRFDSATIGSMP